MKIISLCVSMILCVGLLGCGVEILIPVAKGDQSVFQKLSVDLQVNEADNWDYSKKDAEGVPPLVMGHYITVRMGDGLTSYQKQLQIFVDGVEMRESGSAGLPQQYSYQQTVKKPIQGHEYVLEFRVEKSSYAVKVSMAAGVITSPTLYQKVNSDETLTLAWGGENKPSSLSVGTRYFSAKAAGGCALMYKPKTEAKDNTVFEPKWNKSGKQPPCTGEAKFFWTKIENPTSPFGTLSITRITSKIQPFSIQ